MTTATLIIGTVALIILISAPISGQLANRLGRLRIMTFALWAYRLGLLVPLLTHALYLNLVGTPPTSTALELLRGPLSSTSGFAAIWGAAGASILLSIHFLRRLRGAETDRRELRGQAHEAPSRA